MDYDVLEARYRGGHVVWLRFRDGTTGEIDLAPALRGPVFEPLHDTEYFQRFSIDPEFHTLLWPNGVDIAPSGSWSPRSEPSGRRGAPEFRASFGTNSQRTRSSGSRGRSHGIARIRAEEV